MYFEHGIVSDAGTRNDESSGRRSGARRPPPPRRQRPTPPECPESKRGQELEKIEPDIEMEIQALAAC